MKSDGDGLGRRNGKLMLKKRPAQEDKDTDISWVTSLGVNGKKIELCCI